MTVTRASAFAAVRWTSMAMIGRAAIALAQIVVLSRILDPADFKLVAIAVTIVNIGIVFTDMGISNALIRFRDITPDELVSLFWLNVGIGAVVTSSVALSSPFIARIYDDMRLTPLVLVASLVFVITSLGQQLRALAEKSLKFDVLFRIDIIAAVLGFGIAVSLALLGTGAASIVVGNVATVACVSSLSWLWLADGWRPKMTFSLGTARRFLSFGANVVGISVFNAIALNGDVILGGRWFKGAELGYYFQPRDLCLRIMFIVNPIVTRVSFPLLAAVAHDKPRVKAVYLKAINMTASVNFPIYAFLAVVSPEVVAIVLGPKWGPSAPAMRAVAIWCAVRSIGNPVGGLLLATNETRRAMISAFGVAVAVFAFAAIGANWGALGVPIAMTWLYVILVPVFWAGLIRPACGAGFLEYHLMLATPALTTACGCIAAIAALRFGEHPLVRILLAGVTGGTAYLAASFALNRNWLLSMIELLMLKGVGRAIKVIAR